MNNNQFRSLKRVLCALTAVIMVFAAAGVSVFAADTQFEDLSGDSWAYPYIEYCIQNGLMNGVNESEFQPDGIVSDVMAKTVLQRLVPSCDFDSYIWSEPVEREDMAVLVYTAGGSANTEDIAVAYSDAENISSECYTAVAWCSVNNIMSGKENQTFDPSGYMTRSELAAVAMRLAEYLNADSLTINIIHTNDIHGYDVGDKSVIGMDEISALKKQTDNAVLADAGDATQGIAFVSLDKGASAIEAMNLAGYDVMACGNHEFDYGQETAKKNAAAADFPIISANTLKYGQPFFKGSYADGTKENNGENAIIEIDGVKVGFFGILTSDTASSTKPSGILGISFEDETETAKRQVEELQNQGADVVIGLFHVGVSQASSVTTPAIVDGLLDTSGLDAVIDGHSHTVYNNTENGVLIAQTGSYSENIGIMSVSVKDGEVIGVKENMLSSAEVKAKVTPDPEVTEYLEKVTAEQSKLLDNKIAETKTTLWGGYVNNFAVPRAVETNLGNLICDAMIDEVKNNISAEYSGLPIVSVQNGGGVRASVKNGDITVGSIFNVLPFGNTLFVKEITPNILYSVMERSVKNAIAQDEETGLLDLYPDGGFLQIGGMSVKYDPSGKEGEKVISVTLGGQTEPLDRTDSETKILLATNDFVAMGGNDYDMVPGLPEIMQGTDVEQIVCDYILKLTDNGVKPLEVENTEGRIVEMSGYTAKDYTSSLYLKDINGNLLTDKTVTVYVDGEAFGEFTSNKDGIIKLTLTSGPHSVKTAENAEEAYVNNICGQGTVEYRGEEEVLFPTLVLE